MKIKLDDIDKKQEEMFVPLKENTIRFLASYLSDQDKEDINMGYISIIAILRVAANMAAALGIDKDSFLTGCSNMYLYEELTEKEEKIDKNKPNLDLN